MDNPYESPQDTGEAWARFRLTPRAVVRGIFVFFLAWFLLGAVARFLIPFDSTGDPNYDAASDRLGNVVGAFAIGMSAILGVVVALLASPTRPKREK